MHTPVYSNQLDNACGGRPNVCGIIDNARDGCPSVGGHIDAGSRIYRDKELTIVTRDDH